MSIYVTSGRFAPTLAVSLLTAAIVQMHQLLILEHHVRKLLAQNSEG